MNRSRRALALPLVAVVALGGAACTGSDGPEPDPTALPAPEEGADTVPFASEDGAFGIELPAGWATEDLGSRVIAAPEGGESPRLTVTAAPLGEVAFDDFVTQMTSEAGTEVEVTEATVSGAGDARRIEQAFEEGGRTLLVVADASGARTVVADVVWLGTDDFTADDADAILSTFFLRDPEASDV